MTSFFDPPNAMRSRPFIFSRCIAGLLALPVVLGGGVVCAEDARVSKASWETEFSSSAIGGSRFRGAAHTGNISLRDIGGSAVVSLQAREGVLVRLGADYRRFDFQGTGAFAIPRHLQSVNLVLGTDLQFGEAWLARLEIQPGFYSASAALRGRDLNVPLTLGVSYFASADLQLVAGLSMDLERNYPVLPGIGLRWKMAEKWVLDAILPAPRIEYSATKDLTLYVGAKFDGGSYRTDGRFGTDHGNARLNNAVLDYTQVRVGGGASWKFGPSFTLEVEGGCVPISQLDFHRAGADFHSSGTPAYGAISLKAAY